MINVPLIHILKLQLKQAINALSTVIYPPYCIHCLSFMHASTVFCDTCIKFVTPMSSYKLSISRNYTISVFAVSEYRDPLKKLILAKGYGNRTAAAQLGQLIWYMTDIRQRPIDYFIPIPLHWTRYAWRGFNQSYEMARELSYLSDIPCASLLRRTQRTAFQSQLTKSKREENVAQVFSLCVRNYTLYRNKHLVLVDDLMTTGATLKAAARELKKLRPASITAVVASRVV